MHSDNPPQRGTAIWGSPRISANRPPAHLHLPVWKPHKAYCVSQQHKVAGLKYPKIIDSGTNGAGKPPFGLNLCVVKATGLRMPMAWLTGRKHEN